MFENILVQPVCGICLVESERSLQNKLSLSPRCPHIAFRMAAGVTKRHVPGSRSPLVPCPSVRFYGVDPLVSLSARSETKDHLCTGTVGFHSVMTSLLSYCYSPLNRATTHRTAGPGRVHSQPGHFSSLPRFPRDAPCTPPACLSLRAHREPAAALLLFEVTSGSTEQGNPDKPQIVRILPQRFNYRLFIIIKWWK